MEDDIREAVAGGRRHQVGHSPAQRHAQSPRGRAQDGHGRVVPHVCDVVPVDLQVTGDSAHWQLANVLHRKLVGCVCAHCDETVAGPQTSVCLGWVVQDLLDVVAVVQLAASDGEPEASTPGLGQDDTQLKLLDQSLSNKEEGNFLLYCIYFLHCKIILYLIYKI